MMLVHRACGALRRAHRAPHLRCCSSVGSVTRFDANSGLLVVHPALGKEGKVTPGSILRTSDGSEACVLFSREGHACCVELPNDGGSEAGVETGSEVCSTQRVLSLPHSIAADGAAAAVGKMLDCWGRPLCSIASGSRATDYSSETCSGAIGTEASDNVPSNAGGGVPCRAIFADPPRQQQRAKIGTALRSGMTAVDALTPLGRGQSMLVLGRNGAGKSELALAVIEAQALGADVATHDAAAKSDGGLEIRGAAWGRGTMPVRCIYAVLGSGRAARERADFVRHTLAERCLDRHTTVVLADPLAAAADGDGDDDAGADGDGDADANTEALAGALRNDTACGDQDAAALRGYLAAATAVAVAEQSSQAPAAGASEASDTMVVLDGLSSSHTRLWVRGGPEVVSIDDNVAVTTEGATTLDRAELRLFYSALVQRAAKLAENAAARAGADAASNDASANADAGGSLALAVEGTVLDGSSNVDSGKGGSVSVLVLWDEDQTQRPGQQQTGQPSEPARALSTPAHPAMEASSSGERVFTSEDIELFREGTDRSRVSFLLERGVVVDSAALARIGIAPVYAGADEGAYTSTNADVEQDAPAEQLEQSDNAPDSGLRALLRQHSEEIKSLCDGHMVLDDFVGSSSGGDIVARWPPVDFRRSLSRIGMGSEQARQRRDVGDAHHGAGNDGSANGNDSMGFGGDQWGSATAAAGDPRPPAIRAVAGQLRLRLAVAHEIAKDPSGTVRAASAPGNESKTAAFSSAALNEVDSEALRLAAVEAVLEQPRGPNEALTVAEQVVTLFAVGHEKLPVLLGQTQWRQHQERDPGQERSAPLKALQALHGGRNSPLLQHFRSQADGAALLREIDADMLLSPERARRLELITRVFFQLWAADSSAE